MKYKAFLLFLFLLGQICNCYSQLIPNSENTYVLIVGVLEWKNGLNSFSKVNRKDAELEAFFIKSGVSKNNITALYDSQASLQNIKNAIEKISSSVGKGSTIVFYYAGHGIKQSGEIYFANYDIVTSKSNTTGLAISQLSEKFGKSKASQILLFADCCYSGGLIKVCKELGKSGKQALALTSATASNTSTGNWTFTQTLLDCLNGNKIGDHNKDNIIQLDELKTELFQAMKSRERQMAGYAVVGIDKNTKVAGTKPSSFSCTKPELCGQYFWAKEESNWEPVRILGNEADKFTCEFFSYSDKEQKLMSRKQLRQMHFVKHAKNSKVEVEWSKKWYKATIIDVLDDFCYIKYDGYDDSWNEWVLYDRIRTGKEPEVEVEDQGSFYPAIILDKKDSKYYIHYKDYGHSWDEWVGEKRIKR